MVDKFVYQFVFHFKTVNMVSLGCGSSSLPSLLLQYSYYLNQDATKCVNIGIDSYTFEARMILFSPTLRKGIHLSPTEWTYVHNSYQDVHDFLTYKKERVWFSTNSLAMRSFTTNTCVRMVKLRNNPTPCRKIILNYMEWESLKKITPYLSTLMAKFTEIAPFIADYYRAYLHRCKALTKDPLTNEDYFVPESEGPSLFNSYRLFNEIPIISEEKLTDDLYGLRGYLTIGSNAI